MESGEWTTPSACGSPWEFDSQMSAKVTLRGLALGRDDSQTARLSSKKMSELAGLFPRDLLCLGCTCTHTKYFIGLGSTAQNELELSTSPSIGDLPSATPSESGSASRRSGV